MQWNMKEEHVESSKATFAHHTHYIKPNQPGVISHQALLQSPGVIKNIIEDVNKVRKNSNGK